MIFPSGLAVFSAIVLKHQVLFLQIYTVLVISQNLNIEQFKKSMFG